MRKTKIVCTIGPASSSEEVIKGLCLAGMNVARLNFSHGTHEGHQAVVNTIKKVRSELDFLLRSCLIQKGLNIASAALRMEGSISKRGIGLHLPLIKCWETQKRYPSVIQLYTRNLQWAILCC